jgi:small-conductance mechanosensitive channel
VTNAGANDKIISRVRAISLATALILAAAGAAAQEPPPVEAATAANPAASAEEASLVYFNRTIVVFRVPLFGVSPEGRADRSRDALAGILSEPVTGNVSIQSEPQGNLVLIDGQLAFILVADDADRLRGETLAQVTERAAAALSQVLEETRESRDQRLLIRELLFALAGTAVLLALITVVVLLRRAVEHRLSRLAERAASVTTVGGAQVVSAERLLPLARRLIALLSWALVAVALYRWLSFVLSQFPYTRPWGEQLRSFLIGTFAQVGRGAIGAIPGLAVAALIVFAARLVVQLVTPFFDRAARGYFALKWLDRDTAQPTRRLFTIGVWLFALVMAYPYLPGSQSDAFKGISVLLGLMVTFGGSSLFGQAASGLILMYSRTLRVGEYVRIDDHEGTVMELGNFTTKVRTGLGEELTLPNSLVLGTVVKNYSRAVRGHGFIVDTTVTIGYDTPWRQVQAMLIEAARRTPDVLTAPEPKVFQTSLTDFYPEYRLVCQAIATDPRPRAEVLANLHANIQDIFNEHGVQIMSPHYLGDPGKAKVVPPAQWYPPPARPPDGG